MHRSTTSLARLQALLPALLPALLIAPLLALGAGAAAAQPSRFQPDAVRVIDAARFVNEPSAMQIRLRQPLVLTRQTGAEARSFAAQGFQIRIFPLAAGRMQPDAWASFEPCDVFLSAVSRFEPGSIERLHLGALESPFWLTAEAGRPMQPGRHLLVFENLSDEAGRQFRLDRAGRDAYFSRGLLIEVLPDRSYSAQEVNAQVQAIRQEVPTLQREAADNTPRWRCYTYKGSVVQAPGDDPQALAWLEHCDPQAAAPL